ncbi:MAG: condensation domain-containing protein, partial [Desulfovibrionaceae bacterium]|nr:condensation domain-containing protein [Desulfovibrionaceae bacterium]
RLTLFAAHAFDVAIWELFPGLVSGAVLHVLGDELRRDLPALAAYLRDNAVTDTWMPPHVAALFLKEHSGLGLRSLTAGGDVFKPQGDYPFLLYNNYGPTECAITSTSCRDFAHASPLSIGLPVDNTDMYILDRGGRLQPMGVAGELCITGVQVARGYLNRPELTAASFVPNPFATGPDTARMYKTGDLCRWLPDGSIEFLGRIDQQVKIRGHRIELGEIEKTAQAHPLVAQCVVRVDGGQLCAYIVTRDGADLDVPSVRDFLAEGLPPYMVPEHVLFLDSLPLTASGKIDKKALPAPKPALADFVPPTTPAEEILCTILAEVLERDRIGLTDDFFQLGGDSIKALMVASRLWAKGFRLDLKHLFARAGLAAVARSLVAAEDAGAASPAAEQWRDPAVSPTERERVQARFADRGVRAVYRVTPMQEAMLAAREAEPAAYVIDNWADLDGRLDPDALRERWRLLVARHDALRTVFDLDGERPWQVVLERGATDFRFENLRGLDAPAQDERMRQIQAGLVPPRLDHGPLVRIVLFGLGDGRFRMLLSWHHLVLDGWSLGRVLGELFAPEAPTDPAVSFNGYMRFLSGRDLETDLAWWREALRGAGAPALLPRAQNGRGASRPRRLTFALPRQVDRKLRELAADQGLTLSTLLQAAWAVILARHANQDEVVFGSVVSGRPAAVPGVERLVGLCVATMPVRVACPATESFVGLARTIQTWNLDAEPHAVCSQAEMRNLAGAGLDQLFVFENQPPAANAPDLTITPRHGSGLTGTELAMEWSDPGRLTCAIHYNATLFDDWRMEAVRDHWLVLLEALAQSPEAALGKVSMLTPAEERRILVHCNRTDRDFGPPATVVDLFRQAATRFPERTALVGTDLALTYAELDR